MKFKAHAVMQGSPELKLRCHSSPIDFELGAEGCVKVQLGTVSARVEEVPITLAIPFLRRAGGVQTIGTIGPFAFRLTPVDAEIRPNDCRVAGVVGKEGLDCSLEGRIGCKTEFDVDGTLPGKTARASIEMVDEEESST